HSRLAADLRLRLMDAVFFFSSRRRHTRSKRDWSSDVCSSDLVLKLDHLVRSGKDHLMLAHDRPAAHGTDADLLLLSLLAHLAPEIGRASCREREFLLVVGGYLK